MKTIAHYPSIIFASFFAVMSALLLFAGDHLIEGEHAIIAINSAQQAGSEDQLEQDIDSSDSAQIKVLLKEAQVQSEGRNKISALQRYEQVLILNPNHQIAALNKAILMKSEMGCTLAADAIQHAVNNNRGEKLAKSLSLQASCMMEQQRPEEAIGALKKAIEYFPNHDLLWTKMARIKRIHSDNPDAALITYQRALALAPKDKKLRIEIADFQQQQLDFRGSINTLKAAYPQLKREFESQYLLAWNYLELKMPNNASKHIRLAGRLNKSKRPLLDAMQQYIDGNYEDSIDILKQKLRRQRSGRYLLAMNYVAKGWPKNAQKFLALVANKQDYQARAKLQTWFLNQHQTPQQRIDELERIHQQSLKNSYTNELAAQLLLSQQQSSAAALWLKDLDFPTPSSQLNRLYIEVQWAAGNRAMVFELLQKLQLSQGADSRLIRLHAEYLELDQKPLAALRKLQTIPESDRALGDFHHIAKLALQLKELNMAIEILTNATDTFPESADTRLSLAQALFYNNDHDQSRKQLELLFKLEPQHEAGLAFLTENF